MNTIMNRFQEFAYNWEGGERETPLVPLENITRVPIAFFTGTRDHLCPYDQNAEYIPRFNTETTQVDIKGTHQYFRTKANDDEFMKKLIDELQVPTAEGDSLAFTH